MVSSEQYLTNFNDTRKDLFSVLRDAYNFFLGDGTAKMPYTLRLPSAEKDGVY